MRLRTAGDLRRQFGDRLAARLQTLDTQTGAAAFFLPVDVQVQDPCLGILEAEEFAVQPRHHRGQRPPTADPPLPRQAPGQPRVGGGKVRGIDLEGQVQAFTGTPIDEHTIRPRRNLQTLRTDAVRVERHPTACGKRLVAQPAGI